MTEALEIKRGVATHQIAVMGALGDKVATLKELTTLLPITAKKIIMATGKLVQRGYLERLETGVYRLTGEGLAALEQGVEIKSGSFRGQRQHRCVANSLQQRSWTAMRLTKRFGMSDLFTLAVNERDKNPKAALQQFLRRLRLAGYIAECNERRVSHAPTSNGFKQWRLVRDTGEFSPRYLSKTNMLKDWNTGEVYPIGEVQPCAA